MSTFFFEKRCGYKTLEIAENSERAQGAPSNLVSAKILGFRFSKRAQGAT